MLRDLRFINISAPPIPNAFNLPKEGAWIHNATSFDVGEILAVDVRRRHPRQVLSFRPSRCSAKRWPGDIGRFSLGLSPRFASSEARSFSKL